MSLVESCRAMILFVGVVSVGMASVGVTTESTSAVMAASIEPSSIIVAGDTNSTRTVELLVRTNNENPPFVVEPGNLWRVGGSGFFSRSAIHVEQTSPKTLQETQGADHYIKLTFDLSQGFPGEYQGNILMRHQGGELQVPATLKVKSHYLLPLCLMLAGVVLGMSMNWYRKTGRPRDLILVRLGKLRSQMRTDLEIVAEFRQHIERATLGAETALAAEEWENARSAVSNAEAIWIKWRQWRSEWIKQFAYQQGLLGKLNSAPDFLYVREVRRVLEDSVTKAPQSEKPDELRDTLDGIATELNEFFTVVSRLEYLNQLRSVLGASDTEKCRLAYVAFERRLKGVRRGDDAALQALDNDLGNEIDTWEQAVAAGGTRAATMVEQLHVEAPPTTDPSQSSNVSSIPAENRLWIFMWCSWVLVILFLAMTGFQELYLKNPVFGQNFLMDYFGLFLWGFGAEATRASVAETIQSWDLPVVGPVRTNVS